MKDMLPLPVSIKNENSIKEAVITIFLSNPILKPERFKEILNQHEMSSFYQQHQPLKEITFKVGGLLNDLKGEANLNPDKGFKLIRFEKGIASFVMQGVNEIDRTYFSFHNLSYTRWADFLSQFRNSIHALKTIQSDIFVNGISLHYVDEFVWDKQQEFDLSRIMKAEEFLPNNFIRIKGGHLSNTRELVTTDNQRLFDRLEVLVNSNLEKGISINHNQTVLFGEIADYSDKEISKKIEVVLNELHENNKELLKKILIPEVKDLIKLK